MNHEELDRAIEKARQIREERAREQHSVLERQQGYFAAVPRAAQNLKEFLGSGEGRKIVHYLSLTGKTVQLAEGKITGVWAFSSYADAEIRFYLAGTGLMEARPRYDKAHKIRLGNPKMCCQLWAEQGRDPMFVIDEIKKQVGNFLK